MWYYSVGDERFGPVEAADLKRAANRGYIRPDDFVWQEGWRDWHEAKSVEGLIGPDGVIVNDMRGRSASTPPQSVHLPSHPAEVNLFDCPRCRRAHFVDCGPCPTREDAARETAMA